MPIIRSNAIRIKRFRALKQDLRTRRDRLLVGIDIAPDTQERTIVMLGAHEPVVRTEPARVHVAPSARTVTLHGSAAKLVTPGGNPYVF